MRDQGVACIVRTGRKEPAPLPDQRGQGQLVGPVGEADAAFIESHADAVLRVNDARRLNQPKGRDQAAPAPLVRVVVAARALRTASAVASNASIVEA